MEWTAFCTGVNLTAAIAMGAMWTRDRDRWAAFGFWFNLAVFGLNALVWWAGS